MPKSASISAGLEIAYELELLCRYFLLCRPWYSSIEPTATSRIAAKPRLIKPLDFLKKHLIFAELNQTIDVTSSATNVPNFTLIRRQTQYFTVGADTQPGWLP